MSLRIGMSTHVLIRHRLPITIALSLLMLAMSSPTWAAGADVWVSPLGDDTTGTGSTSAPYRTISKALDVADGTDTVSVLPGRYDTAAGETFPLDVSQGEDIVCVGPGPAIIIGDRDHSVIYAANQGLGTGVSILLRGLHITGGAPGPDPGDFTQSGSGISCQLMGTNDTLTIEHCTVFGNQAATDSNGGGIFVSTNFDSNASVTIRDCLIADNEGEDGGGISMISQLADSTATLRVERCVIRDNVARSEGGGIHSQYTYAVHLLRCEITDNDAEYYYGGVYVTGVAAGAMNNLLVTRNTADQQSAMRLRVRDTYTYWVGGSTFAGNIDYLDGTHWTILADSGPGLGTARLNGCIAWDNEPTGVSGYQVTFSCTEDGSVTGTGVFHTDPQFVSPTGLNPDFHLRRTSPCIDTGNDEGTYGVDLEGWSRPMLATSGDMLDDIGCYESAAHDAVRAAGDDRYKTASAAWAPRYSLDNAYTAVVASGENFPDALAASALAGVVRGPLLLTPKASLSSSVVPRLQALGVTGVYVIGGTPAVSSTVVTQLEAAGFNVVRLEGDDRYKTAAAVAREVWRAEGPAEYHSVLVARGDTFPDALAAAPWAYAEGIPVLLTPPTSLSQPTAAFISSYGVSRHVYVLGSTSAVSDPVKNAIDTIDGGTTPLRLWGRNRYETAAAIAEYATGIGDLTWQSPGLATGTKFPDALAGGAACGARGSALLLTDPLSLSPAAASALTTHKSAEQQLIVLGKAAAVSDTAMTAAAALIR